MRRSKDAGALFSRLASHFLSRLRHAQAAEAIIAAMETEFLALGAFSHDGVLGGVLHAGRLAIGRSEAEIRNAICLAENSRRQTGNFVVEDGEFTLVREGGFLLTKFSGGRSALSRSRKNGKLNAQPNDRPRDDSLAQLLRTARACASPPDAASYVVLLLIADALVRTGLSIADVLGLLRRPRPIVSIFGSTKGFEDIFLDLLDRGFLIPGAVSRSNGYSPSVPADLRASLGGEAKRRVVCFRGANYGHGSLDEWTLQAARRTLPILCVAESAKSVPPKLVAASDLVLECGPPTAEILRAAIQGLLGDIDAGALDGVDCSRLGLPDIALAFGPGKTSSDAIELLGKLAVQRSEAGQTDSPKHLSKSDKSKRTAAAGSSGSELIRPEQPIGNATVPMIETLAGYGEAKTWALRLKQDLEQFQSGRLAWESLSPTLLLSGPPGTGKALFARALCNSLQLPLFYTSVSTWLEPSHLGEVINRMKVAFEETKALSPAILFVDEIDGIGVRADSRREYADYWNAVVNTFLELLGGIVPLTGIIVVGATNRPLQLDPALLRSGRLQPHYKISLPDVSALTEIIRYHLRDDLASILASASGADGAFTSRRASRGTTRQTRTKQKRGKGHGC